MENESELLQAYTAVAMHALLSAPNPRMADSAVPAAAVQIAKDTIAVLKKEKGK